MVQQADDNQRFCTIACAQLDLSRSPARVTIACGGHPLPLVVRADGTHRARRRARARCSGSSSTPSCTDSSVELRSGDTLVLYTDGLTEAGAPELVWTPEEIADAVRVVAGAPPADTVAHLLATTVDGVPSPRDDVAVLALRAD